MFAPERSFATVTSGFGLRALVLANKLLRRVTVLMRIALRIEVAC